MAAVRSADGAIPPATASPVAAVEAISRTPRMASSASPRARAVSPRGCSRRGTSAISANARPSATVTPSPAHSAPPSPITSATPLPLSGCTLPLSSLPSTGIRASAESTTWARSVALSSSTKPRIDTNANNSGKSETKA